jgi:hypothetical protein
MSSGAQHVNGEGGIRLIPNILAASYRATMPKRPLPNSFAASLVFVKREEQSRFAATTAVMADGLGLVGFGAATGAQAQPRPLPDYHWCTGPVLGSGLGPNWD